METGIKSKLAKDLIMFETRSQTYVEQSINDSVAEPGTARDS